MLLRPGRELCQSCGLPMDKAEDRGSEADGRASAEYCRDCYQRGSFTSPGLTQRQMLDICVREMARKGVMPKAVAWPLMRLTLPRLKRWRGT